MNILPISNQVVIESIMLATQYHMDQNRWNGEPYILHPLRVMLKMKSNYGRCVAVLHDILEDTSATKNTLLEKVNREIVDSVVRLSKKGDYDSYIGNLLVDPAAIAVKIADIEDNLNIWDLSPKSESPTITEKHCARMNKYLKTLGILREHKLRNIDF